VHADIHKQVNSIEDPTDPIGVLQVGGSITSWLGDNPSYTVYELDIETMLPVSRRLYYFDMDEANVKGYPEWQLGTDWTADYSMADLSPNSFKKLTKRLGTDEALTVDYKNRKMRHPNYLTECDE